MTQIKPVGNRILVKLEKQSSERVVGGIVVSTNAKNETPHTGTVVAIGDKVDKDLIHINDIIVFGKYALTEINLDGEKCHLVSQDEVLGVVQFD